MGRTCQWGRIRNPALDHILHEVQNETCFIEVKFQSEKLYKKFSDTKVLHETSTKPEIHGPVENKTEPLKKMP